MCLHIRVLYEHGESEDQRYVGVYSALKRLVILEDSAASSYSTTNKMHLLCQIIYSCKTLYMFRTVFPSIIRSSKLRVQQQVHVKRPLLPAATRDEMEQSSISSLVAAAVSHTPVAVHAVLSS